MTRPRPVGDPVIAACDWIDLQAVFRRVSRARAEEILDRWAYVDELTPLQRERVLARYP